MELSPDEVEPSLDEVKSHHWSKMVRSLLTKTMIAAHIRGITKVKNLVVITNFIPILDQCHLVILIVVYASMGHCSFHICSHTHPTLFDAGLTYSC